MYHREYHQEVSGLSSEFVDLDSAGRSASVDILVREEPEEEDDDEEDNDEEDNDEEQDDTDPDGYSE